MLLGPRIMAKVDDPALLQIDYQCLGSFLVKHSLPKQYSLKLTINTDPCSVIDFSFIHYTYPKPRHFTLNIKMDASQSLTISLINNKNPVIIVLSSIPGTVHDIEETIKLLAERILIEEETRKMEDFEKVSFFYEQSRRPLEKFLRLVQSTPIAPPFEEYGFCALDRIKEILLEEITAINNIIVDRESKQLLSW